MIIRRVLVRRNTLITWFVIGWTLLFHYETLRASYLSPLAQRNLPKVPFLFPPAGWIMFYNVDKTYGYADVYGIRHGQSVKLDPHDILETRAVGYDNIHRNVLVGALDPQDAPQFCRFLHRKFPAYQSFVVLYAQYPDVVGDPDRVLYRVAYRCP
jgi:hypothetical protein